MARIADEGRLADGWNIDTAAAFLWALTAPATFHLLVVERGWTPQQWADHTHRLLHDALIRLDAPPGPGNAPAPTAQVRPTKNTQTHERQTHP